MSFAAALLNWYKKHGRHDLPWRQAISPYRVWLSEIMLQQTQVKTVIPYYEKFIDCYLDVAALATASLDDVLHLWTGLGYYSRARNLHKTAQIIHTEYANAFPNNLMELTNLPGIGRSTAGAILAIAFQKKAPILDGNVKRILARFFAVTEPLNETKTQTLLWTLAEKNLPNRHIDFYTQASMDLGALICTRTNPKCEICPVQKNCLGFKKELQHRIPMMKKKKAIPIKQTHMLIFQNNHQEVFLERRTLLGVWGNLWSFPECELETDVADFCQKNYLLKPMKVKSLNSFRHTFSHFHLDIHPLLIKVKKLSGVMESKNFIWYKHKSEAKLGMPAPVVKLITQLFNEEN